MRRVAITGVGVISPVGTGVDRFWEGLLNGRSGISHIESFDTAGHRVQIAGEIRDFDPSAHLDAREVDRLDRFSQFALVAARMAVADADFEPADPNRVATVFGSGIGGASTVEHNFRRLLDGGPRRVSPIAVPATIPNMAAGQIALALGFGGPSVCPVSACASSADAIGWGFRLVRDGYADACLAGGSEACITAATIAGFANMGALSKRNDAPQEASRPFDSERDGFVLSEGSGAVLLEALEHVEAREGRVYAEVRGYGQASDAFHETQPDPEGAGCVRAITAALEEAEMDPSAIDYINAHGTGTMQDAIETKAIRRVFGDHAAAIPISSTKSMTGHLLGAAGAIEAIACSMSLRDGIVAPTMNLAAPGPGCDLDYVPNEARQVDPEAVLSNSIGFGGHNVALVLAKAREGGSNGSR